MKKILFGITSLTLGGAERVLVDLANKLCEKYEITIFTIYANGELEKLPQALRSEYFYIPRGRVVFHKDTGRYTVLHGGLKKSELNKICKFFSLSKELTEFDTDFHYTLKISF